MGQLFNKLDIVFFERPSRAWHIRELARALKKSPTTVSKHLQQLHKERVLTKHEERGHTLYRADTTSAEYLGRKIAYNHEKLRRSGLITYLDDQYNHPEAIILFGSYARGEDDTKSDIDLALITAATVKVNISGYEKQLNRNVQAFTISRKDVERMKSTDNEMLNTLVNGTVMHGFWEVFR